MALVVLARHGRTEANAGGVLAGWLPGVDLDDRGREQAARLGSRLAGVPLAAVVSSPLQRCLTTARAVLAARPAEPAVPDLAVEEGLGECRYGAWTGRSLRELAAEPLWRSVQDAPSTVTFPAHPEHEHESMQQMHDRAVAAVAAWDARVEQLAGPGAVWLAVSHGDVIKAVLAHALGTDLDRFQRISVDPGSLSIVRLTDRRPLVLRVNDTSGEPVDLSEASGTAVAEPDEQRGDAPVGGGTGRA